MRLFDPASGRRLRPWRVNHGESIQPWPFPGGYAFTVVSHSQSDDGHDWDPVRSDQRLMPLAVCRFLIGEATRAGINLVPQRHDPYDC